MRACNFDASWPTETHSTSLERSQPSQQMQAKFKGIEGLLIQVMVCQSDLISIGLM